MLVWSLRLALLFVLAFLLAQFSRPLPTLYSCPRGSAQSRPIKYGQAGEPGRYFPDSRPAVEVIPVSFDDSLGPSAVHEITLDEAVTSQEDAIRRAMELMSAAKELEAPAHPTVSSPVVHAPVPTLAPPPSSGHASTAVEVPSTAGTTREGSQTLDDIAAVLSQSSVLRPAMSPDADSTSAAGALSTDLASIGMLPRERAHETSAGCGGGSEVSFASILRRKEEVAQPVD